MRRELRTFLLGALLLPLSAVPFGVYATRTPEGRLILDRVSATLTPPELPDLDAATRARIARSAPRYTEGVAVLVYHGIGSGVSGEGSYSLSPGTFAEHLVSLRTAGFVPVTMQEVAEAWESGRPLPGRAVALTFDDGRTDAMMFADPLLEDAGWRATMYVISERAEGRTSPYYVGWDELVDHHRSGRWDLQSHTDDLHGPLETGGGELPALTALADGETRAEYRARIRADLRRAARRIEARTGVHPKTFAYPFGAHGADRTNDPAIARILAQEIRRLHVLAVHQDGQDEPHLATACDEPTQIRRIEVGDWSGPELVERIAAAALATPPCPRQELSAG